MYTAYKNAIETLIKTNLNAIKTVDWYNQQYENYEDEKAINFPACYIEFEDPIDWQSLASGVQQATNAKIRLHLVSFDIADSPEPAMELTTELHKVIHTKRLMDGSDQLSTELMRTQSELITRYDQLKVTILSYQTTLIDCSAVKATTTVTASLVVETTIKT